MKIIVLDGFTLNPGDLDWEELKALGTCEIYERTLSDQIVPRASDAEIVLTNKTLLGRAQILNLPKLRYIGVLATGYNVVDVLAARERDVPVCNVPMYGTRSVAQMTFALLLELTQHVGHHSNTVRVGRWAKSADWCYWDFPLIELEGLVMGVVGFGRIGRAVADLAVAFGMSVLVHSRTVPRQFPPKIEFVDLPELFRRSDVVSLHCPLTSSTHNLINAESLAWMKPWAFLLNTSRGQLVQEQDLAAALNTGKIAGAGLDVLSVEPPPQDNPLLKARNCLVTPHIAWATRAARVRLMKTAIDNVRSFLSGTPKNVVN